MKKKAVKKEEKSNYKASVIVLGKTYTAQGETISKAIEGLKPGNCKGKSILVIENGDVRKEKILMPMTTQRLFGFSGLVREIALKNASLMFQGI